MTSTEQERASEQINLLAGRNSWPLIGDPLLRFATPQLKSVHEIWEAKRGARTMPARGDLTMSDLKMVLPNLAFLSIVRDGARTRFKAKLIGSDLDKFMGGAMTGRFLDEAVPKRFVDKWVACGRRRWRRAFRRAPSAGSSLQTSASTSARRFTRLWPTTARRPTS